MPSGNQSCPCGKDPGGFFVKCSKRNCDAGWWHTKCAGLKGLKSEDQISSIGTWDCPLCVVKSLNIINNVPGFASNIALPVLEKVEKKLQDFDSRIQELKEIKEGLIAFETNQRKEHQNFKEEITEIAGSRTSDNENTSSSWASLVAKQVVQKSNEIMHDRELREKNVILFNVLESCQESKEDRFKDDEEFFFQLCDKVEVAKPSTTKIVRVGKKSNDKKRPLKVCFEKLLDKRKFLSNLYHLKEAPEPFKNVQIQHDLTPEDRDTTKSLLKEAYGKNNEEKPKDFLYKVRGPPGAIKIVKIFNRR